MSRNIVIWGKTGTTKSSLALSSKRRKHMFEWDIGSYERAKKDASSIELHQYPAPLSVLEDFGFIDTSSMGKEMKGPAHIGHDYKGWTEVYWHGFIQDYLNYVKAEPAETYAVIDTTKPIWEAAQNSIRQRFQEDPRFKNMTTDKLKTAEYDTPNQEQRALIHAAKSYNHDLVWVGHAKDTWDNNTTPPGYTGKWVLDGWKYLENSADIVLETTLRSNRTLAIVRKGPLGILGWELTGMSLDGLLEFYDAAKVVSDNDMEMPAGDDYPNRIRKVLDLAGQLL